MKLRIDFITNSSSSSFTIRKSSLSEKQIHAIWNHSALGDMLKMDSTEWSWDISNVAEFITGETPMDNFDMAEFLDIIGVRDTQITWGHYDLEFPKDDEDIKADADYINKKESWGRLLDEVLTS
jgi:hypothetical protein